MKGGLRLDRKAGWEEGGESGAVIVPGNPAERLLIQMINHAPEVEVMPPKSKLSQTELGVLTEWVTMGAPDPRGESKAFEQDYWMPHTWRYRDYLIRAFNQDVPYDQFVREALAGDLLERPRLDPENGFNESVAGPGFLHLADGHHGVTDLHEDEARVIDSMINVVGTAFHGLTISCARCHDHKFDAITDEDYYSLYGMFRSSRLHYANQAESKWTKERQGELRSANQELVRATLENAAGGVTNLGGVMTEVRKLADDADLVQSWRKLNPKDGQPRRLFVMNSASWPRRMRCNGLRLYTGRDFNLSWRA